MSARNRRIVWSPHAHAASASGEPSLFLCSSGIDARLYEWLPGQGRPSESRIRPVGLFTDKTPIKCMAWCPKTPDLIAIGNSNGRVVVTNLSSISALDHSLRPPSQPSGLAGAVAIDHDPTGHSGSLSSIATRPTLSAASTQHAKLPMQQELFPLSTRTCNVVAFCPASPQLLLSGYDKARNDHCLLIWDVAAAHQSGDIKRSSNTHLHRSSEALPATSRAAFAKPVVQYSPTESVSSAAWFYDSSPRFVAGMGLKNIRNYDLRVDSSRGAAFTIVTRAVHGLSADPFFSHRFASFGDDGVVRIWDERKTAEPVLALQTEYKNTTAGISWSPTQPGMLHCHGQSPTVRFWSIQSHEGDSDACATQAQQSALPGSFTNGAANALAATDSFAVASQQESSHESEPFVWKTRSAKFGSPVHDFAWIPLARTANPHFIVSLGPAAHFAVADLRIQPQFSVSPDGQTAISTADIINVVDTHQFTSSPLSQGRQTGSDDAVDISTAMRLRCQDGYRLDATRNLAICSSDRHLTSFWQLMALFSQTPTGAAKANGSGSAMGSSSNASGMVGYSAGVGTNSGGNSSIGSDNAFQFSNMPLGGTAAFLSRMPLQGIYSLIVSSASATESLGSSNGMQYNREFLMPSDSGLRLQDSRGHNATRRIALALCGYDVDDGVDAQLSALLSGYEQQGRFEKAAAVALFTTGRFELAIKCLQRSGNNRLQLIAAALAGATAASMAELASSNSGASAPQLHIWRDVFSALSVDLQDPHLSALFSMASANGDWQVVLNGENLPIEDRVAVALRFLSDDKLAAFLGALMQHSIAQGHIDGLLLTGFGKAGMDLVENYINNTADIQTAALVASYAVHDDGTDPRPRDWIEQYRLLLDRWRLYHERAQFDIQRRKLARSMAAIYRAGGFTGPSAAASADLIPPQVFVRCNFCSQPITIAQRRPMPVGSGGGVGASGGAMPSMALLGGGAGHRLKMTACPNCRKSLPRCAICSHVMGSSIDAVYGAPALADARSSGAVQPSTMATEAPTGSTFQESTSSANVHTTAVASAIDSWFTWCQTCNHGGHTRHILDWFGGHDICPVSDCTCRCLDNCQ